MKKTNRRPLEVRPRLQDHMCTSSGFPTEPYGYVYDMKPTPPQRRPNYTV